MVTHFTIENIKEIIYSDKVSDDEVGLNFYFGEMDKSFCLPFCKRLK